MSELTPLPESFVVRPWVDPVVERVGFSVNSLYTETVLLSILGPATTLCLRRVGMWAAACPNGIGIDTQQLARDLGLGDSLARNGAMSRTLNRLCQFDMAQWIDRDLVARTKVAPLSERQLQRLSPDLVGVHRRMVNRLMMETRVPSPSPSSTAVSVAKCSRGSEMVL